MSAPTNYYNDSHPLFAWLVVCFVVLFGVGFLLAGIDKLTYAVVEGAGKVLIGLIILAFAARVCVYFFRPALRLSEDSIGTRSIWGWFKLIRFDDIERFGVYEQANRGAAAGGFAAPRRSNVIVKSEHLVCSLLSGKTLTITLPNFDSADILSQLKLLSGREINSLSPRKVG